MKIQTNNRESSLLLRTITEADWPAIVAIEQAVYSEELSESEEVLRAKALLGRECSFLFYSELCQVAGYLLAYPLARGTVPALQSIFAPSKGENSNIYIHDFALAPKFHGRKLGGYCIDRFLQYIGKQGYRSCSLTAVMGAELFWQKQGFLPNPQIEAKGYGERACYMELQLSSGGDAKS